MHLPLALLYTVDPMERKSEVEVLKWTALLLRCLRLYCEIWVQDLLPVKVRVEEVAAIVQPLLQLPSVKQLPGTVSSKDSS